MHGAPEFLEVVTIALGVAAVVTVDFQRLRLPVVLGYIIAGLIIGPHVPVPLVADREMVQTLSEFGVILLMFCLGLEFSIRRLIQVGLTAGITAVVHGNPYGDRERCRSLGSSRRWPPALVSLLAHAMGYSVALGAFLAGSLVAESGEAKTVEHLICPVRDMFAAGFFVWSDS